MIDRTHKDHYPRRGGALSELRFQGDKVVIDGMRSDDEKGERMRYVKENE